ncbi:LuxR family transcriptional regulator [Nocardioides nitrophenolicus]|uniref:LuxR family transcriptional regulator n=1 Tax=Nocardioides nitrophenolicus TaxID=60489 RepID=UPI00195BD9A0|nr:LuxR family transcriptional regulator [Nocardioides nitrophenolicus]MBM7517502.1 DNA-binding CsgD family transcriptional regulator [Nocardioides nitrophenolicus]
MDESPARPGSSLPPLLVAELVTSPTVDDLLRRFLDEATHRLAAFAVGVYVHDHATGRPTVAQIRGLGSYYVNSYERYGRDQDPVVQAALRGRQVADSDSLMSPDEWRGLPVVRDVFAPHAMARVLCAPFVVGGEVAGTLNLARHDDQPAFSDADREAARTAAAVLGIAVAAADERRSVERERTQLRAALDRCRTPVVVTDLDAARRHLNAPALDLFAKIGVAGQELVQLLDCDDERGVDSVTAPDGHGGQMVITVTSQRLPDHPEVVVSVLGLEGAGVGDLDPSIRQLLTEREADVAACALRGRSDREIADELFLSPHTVKHHIKSIYAKLGVHTRVQLLTRLRG